MTTNVQVRDGIVTHDGLRLHYREWGSANAPPLIVLHGMNSHARAWDPFAQTMADAYRVLALDQRGHGESDWAAEYTLEGMAADTYALLQALGLSRTTLLGTSMGGINAYLFASHHPEMVERLVIVDVAPDVDDNLAAARANLERSGWTGWPAVVASMEEARALVQTEPPIVFDDPETAVQASLAAFPARPADEQRQRILDGLVQRDDGRWTWRYDPMLRSPILGMAPSTEAQWALVTQIACPTLLVRGVNSPILSRETAERVARTIPDCRLAEVPDSGHAIFLDNPTGFMAVVRPFLLGTPC